jgi:fibronectin type III domain protein
MFAIRNSTIAMALSLSLHSFTAPAADRTPPSKPGNFTVTAKTAYSVTLAWTPSKDNSGNFTYFIGSTAGGGVTLPKTATSYTWTAGLVPPNSYTFIIYARDAAGNTSGTVGTSTTLPADTTPPTVAPVVSVTTVGSTYVSLAWTASQDDSPALFYHVFVNGVDYTSAGTNRSLTITPLQPSTSYTFNVVAYDYGGNASPASAPVTATTMAPNSNDTTPPTTPGNLRDNGMAFPDGETWLWWDQSTDDVDPQAVIRYDVYANGVLDHSLVGGGFTILYGNPGYPNTFQVVAVDTTGNQSVPATLVTAP